MRNFTPPTSELLKQLESGEVTSVDLTQSCLDRINTRNPEVNAFLAVSSELALEKAAEVDQKRKAGDPVGLLAGIPVGVKDNICTTGIKTTCSSRMLENFVPPYSATSVEKLDAADAVIVGKCNLDEFAMGSTTESSYFGTTNNPWDTNRVPGGSSGGSAAAVADQQAIFSLGSDTGGSIRQPAAFCGVVGLKPTYGRVSRYGLVAFASSLDQIGPFAQDVEGAALLLEAIAGPDPLDSTCLDHPVPEYSKTFDQPLEGLRIGIVESHFEKPLDDEIGTSIRNVIAKYESLGATITPIELPHAKYAVATYYLIAPSEASSNLSRYDGIHYGHRAEQFGDLMELYCNSRSEGFGNEVKRRIMLGSYALSSGYYDAYYLKALKLRRLVRNDYDEAFKNVDVVLGPTTPTTAFKHGDIEEGSLLMYQADVYTISANLGGLPAMSIPCGVSSEGLPIGFQLMAPPMQEEKLLQAARMYEREHDWKAEL